jgi:hypothetical protein
VFASRPVNLKFISADKKMTDPFFFKVLLLLPCAFAGRTIRGIGENENENLLMVDDERKVGVAGWGLRALKY